LISPILKDIIDSHIRFNIKNLLLLLLLLFLIKILNIIGKNSLTIYCIDYFITRCICFDTFWIHFFLSIILGILYGEVYNILFKYLSNKLNRSEV
jgi:hypothetical protein